jgi:divinyl protochlorophyllide a 8-vinyl-reductase
MNQVNGIDRVGPNAILQSIEALRALAGQDTVERIFAGAGLHRLLEFPPQDMVPASQAARLHAAIARELPPDLAFEIARESGRRTGEYILAHRIPRPAQWWLRALPARLSGRLLIKAICHHSWTFAGNAVVSFDPADPMELSIHDNPIAVAGCAWHRSVFQTLFHRLVSQDIVIEHPACCATGDQICRFLFHRNSQAVSR